METSMRKPSTSEDDFLYELKDVLSDAVDNRRWSSVEEAFEMVLEQLGEESFTMVDDDVEDC
jgi:rRNA maturation protein Rpf1